MPLPDPALDSRTYRELLTDALARVPVHTPEWSNFNDSDPGVTLLQLFAFLAESVIYRANRIPSRNRQKFLRLLGLGLRPAEPAQGLVCFSLQAGTPLAPVELREDQQLLAGNIPFRTQTGLLALPIESRAYYKQRLDESLRAQVEESYNRLYASIRKPAEVLTFYQTVPLVEAEAGSLSRSVALPDTVDRCLWLALLSRDAKERDRARSAIAGRVITLGIAPALDATGRALYPLGASTVGGRQPLVFELPDTNSATPRYRLLEVVSADDVLASPGLVSLRLPNERELGSWDALGPLEVGVGDFPPALENSADLDRLITWIRLRVPRREDAEAARAGRAPVALSFVGVNAARVLQRTHVAGERLTDGSGEPDQQARLANTPVLLQNVRLTVNGELWYRVDDLSEAGPEVPVQLPRNSALRKATPDQRANVFALDRESGTIQFGDGLRGARPPRGAVIACSYDFGGGSAGLVATRAISRGANLPPGVVPTNPVPTWGASDTETVEQAEKRIPATLRHREALGTLQDYFDIIQHAPGVDIGRTEVLPLTHPDLPGQSADGVVTILVVPAGEGTQIPAPRPDQLMLDTLCGYLEPRRIVTTELHLRGPEYRQLAIGIGVQAVPGIAEGPLTEAVRRAVLTFLSPLTGGFDGKGWPLSKNVEPVDVLAAAARVPGVARVTGVLLADGNGGAITSALSISGLELPEVVAIRVVGGAPSLQAPPPETVTALPVPVIPGDC